MKNKLISVIMPIYDRTDLLREAIESILAQKYEAFELLLIMDGSPKETIDVVMEYYDHPKVRIFKTEQQTGNACIPRNIGIKEASGDYVVFLDSDDLAEPTRLQDSFDALQDADVIHGNFYLLHEDGTREVRFHKTQTHEELMRGNGQCHSTVACKLSVLRNAFGFKRKMHYMEDYELWCRLSEYGYVIKHIDKILSTYRFHSGNLEKQIGDDKWKDELLKEYKILPKEMDLVDYKEINL